MLRLVYENYLLVKKTVLHWVFCVPSKQKAEPGQDILSFEIFSLILWFIQVYNWKI